MAKRKIIKIDERKCSGCGKCALACAEGAIKIIDGKAKLISEKYCDGLGACIGECPENAIIIEEREAEDFEGDYSFEDKQKKAEEESENFNLNAHKSELSNWPVKLNLVNPAAPYFRNADILVAADCSAFSDGDFHRNFIKRKVVVIGCPKFNDVKYYIEKLTEIFRHSDIKSVTVARMEVPCCFGLTFAVESALKASGKDIPLKEHIITIKGENTEKNTSK